MLGIPFLKFENRIVEMSSDFGRDVIPPLEFGDYLPQLAMNNRYVHVSKVSRITKRQGMWMAKTVN